MKASVAVSRSCGSSRRARPLPAVAVVATHPSSWSPSTFMSTSTSSWFWWFLSRKTIPSYNNASGYRYPMSTTTTTNTQKKNYYYTASFSGAGHLLPYHLGVAKVLKDYECEKKKDDNDDDEEDGEQRQQHQNESTSDITTTKPTSTPSGVTTANKKVTILAVSGSSSGAIAAVCFALFSPEKLERYTDRFLQERGHALTILQDFLLEDDEVVSDEVEQIHYHHHHHHQRRSYRRPPTLSIATTRCSDGSLYLHNFAFDHDNDDVSNTQYCPSASSFPSSSPLATDPSVQQLMRAVQASCTIPASFHPVDVFSSHKKGWLSSSSSSLLIPSSLSYPNDEGIDIDGISYVDGGISAPIPPTALDFDPLCEGRIRICPISGGNGSVTDTTAAATTTTTSNNKIISIRPDDDSFSLPFLSTNMMTTRCNTFDIRPSVQNLRALVVSAGLVHPTVLKDWYNRGIEDAQRTKL